VLTLLEESEPLHSDMVLLAIGVTPDTHLAKEAGMKYFVFTTKHHDGFCMWDTRETDYKITSEECPFHTAPNADVVKELFRAFGERDFMIGAYFSKPDWRVLWSI